MYENKLLAAESLDIGFSYSKDYVSFLSNMSVLDETDWWLVGTSKGFFELCFNLLNKEKGSKKLLVPFAKNDETKALACFDEDGKVYFYVDESSLSEVDWNKRFCLSNFSLWLERVINGEM